MSEEGGSTDSPRTAEQLEAEREEAIFLLRSLCARLGDNDWDDNLHLADIIEKHLAKYIEGED